MTKLTKKQEAVLAYLQDYLEKYQKPHHVFCPLGYADWHKVLEPEAEAMLDGAYAIHLWNERWRAAGQDKNAQYSENCLYEQLKRRYSCGGMSFSQ